VALAYKAFSNQLLLLRVYVGKPRIIEAPRRLCFRVTIRGLPREQRGHICVPKILHFFSIR